MSILAIYIYIAYFDPFGALFSALINTLKTIDFPGSQYVIYNPFSYDTRNFNKTRIRALKTCSQ